jgi:GT2 family glycosyltransferase
MRPGRFNFSWLCNEGAAAARGDALVFLNNDIEVTEPGWLRALLAWVDRPGVGAVGARLSYPGRSGVQHDGVVLGIGGFAGHVYARRPREGWDGNDDAPRRVSAVTGACLAVMRAKFEAVGGFDAVDLPVDLSDVDLCLKLDQAGWGSLLVPTSRLIHRESATRGDAVKPFKQYGRERRVFRERWGERLRDDPFYHPALSLWSRGLRLG